MPAAHVAIATPLNAGGTYDRTAMHALVIHLRSAGIDGIVPCGTTGEGPSFSVDQRRDIIEHVISLQNGAPVIAGTGCQSLADTIALTTAATNAGAGACLVLPPFFFKQAGENGILSWYRALCDAVPARTKIILYHIPPMTGIAITPTIIDGLLASHPDQVAGIKDSGVDAAHTAMLTSRYPQLHIYTGNAPLLGQAIRDGAAGSILAVANIVPEAVRRLTDNPTDAATQQYVAAVDAYVRVVGAVPTIKAILAGQHLPVGAPMYPVLAHPDPLRAQHEFAALTVAS